MALIDCPECGHRVDDAREQCIYCGWKIGEQSVIDCPKCGHQVRGLAKTCPGCGADLPEKLANGDRLSQADRRLRRTELELELARINLEWERERQRHLVNRGILGRQAPTKSMASWCPVGMGIFGIAIGILYAVAHSDPAVGLCIGGFCAVLLLVLGLVSGRLLYRKAVEYEGAEAFYLQRKKAVRAKLRARDQAQPNEPAS